MESRHTGYNQVQFIAYQIYTGNDGSRYVGINDDIQVDIQARVELVKRALNIAYKKADGKSKTLKIFMMPEFFFRGPQGAYSLDNVQTIITKLRKLVWESRWEHWLFVFGTIVGDSSPVQKKTVQVRDKDGKQKIEEKLKRDTRGNLIIDKQNTEAYNFAFVQKGGLTNPDTNLMEKFETVENHITQIERTKRSINNAEAKKQSTQSLKERLKTEIKKELEATQELQEALNRMAEKAFIVLKQYKDPTDFINSNKNGNNINYISDSNLDPNNRPRLSEINSSPAHGHYSGMSAFSYNEITFTNNQPIIFGLEVCADHLAGRLRYSQENGLIDIHLIASCGMSIARNNIAARPDGYVFLCDGLQNGVQIIRCDATSYQDTHQNSQNNPDVLDILLNTRPGQLFTNEKIPNGCVVEKLAPDIKVGSRTVTFKEIINISLQYQQTYNIVFVYPPQPLTPPPESFSSKLFRNILSPGFSALGKIISSIPRSIFPILSGLPVAMSDEPILLNGMKVLFDNPTSTTPVTLQPKQRGTNNGR